MTDKAEIPDAWSPFGKPRGTRDPELNLDARAQAFLDRIAPLSADLAAHGHTRARALQKLRRICQAEVRRLKERLTPATVKLYLSKYRDAIRQIDPDHLGPAPQKDALGASAFPTSLFLRRKPGRSTRPTTSASTRTNPT